MKKILRISLFACLGLLPGLVWGDPVAAVAEFEPSNYVKKEVFRLAFTPGIELDKAADILTQVRIDFLKNTFLWFEVLEDNGQIAPTRHAWDEINLAALEREDLIAMELLSVELHEKLLHPVEVIENLPQIKGKEYRTGTPLDMARHGAPLLSNGKSLCTFVFKEAKFDRAALYMRELTNITIDQINGRLTDMEAVGKKLDLHLAFDD